MKESSRSFVPTRTIEPKAFDSLFPSGPIYTIAARGALRWVPARHESLAFGGAVMSPIPTFRPIGPADEAFLRRLYASTREDELSQVQWKEGERAAFVEQQFTAQHRYYQQTFKNASFDLLLLGGEPAGRLYIDRRDDEIRVIDIALLAQHRGSGVGSDLMNDILAEAQEVGKPVRIHVERFNPALRFYHRLGFEQVEDQGVYYLMEWRPKMPGE